MKDMKGQIIVIEGTDCSGKETQSKLIEKRLIEDDIPVFRMSFPQYDTPTGRIVGGPVLGKPAICDSYWGEKASLIPPRVISLYYAADRLYNLKPIIDALNAGKVVLLDRYSTSSMAFQGSKFDTPEERQQMFAFIDELEYDLLGLPRPDNVIFLHMPYDAAAAIRAGRAEKLDRVESDEEYMRRGEQAYIELANLYGYRVIECAKDGKPRSIEDINDEVYAIVKGLILGDRQFNI